MTEWKLKASQCPTLLKEVQQANPWLTDGQVLTKAGQVIMEIATSQGYDVKLLVTCRKWEVDMIRDAILDEAPDATVTELDPGI